MTLSSAINTAKSSLSAVQTQTALISRNIANANVDGATRKYAEVVTTADGRVEVRSISQSSNTVLFRNMLDSTSAVAATNTVNAGLTRINEMLGDIENGQTPSALMGTLQDKLKAYAANPTSIDFARSAADAAQNVVTALNEGSRTVEIIRRDADSELATAAADMTKILAKIEQLNKDVVAGTYAKADVTDLVDERDRAVAQLSQYVGVTAQVRGQNDLVLYTDSGVVLFDKVPRSVTFETTHPLVAGQDGNAFKIDGILVTGDNAVMPVKSGKVAGLVQLRDDIAVTYQTQLDEMARGLIEATSERRATGADVPGLFTSIDPAALATTSTLAAGTFDATKLPAAGDKLSFTLTLGQTTYAVTGTMAAGDLTDKDTFAAKLQSMIAAAVPTAGGAALGTGHVAVAADAAGVITLTAGGVAGKLPLAVADLASTTPPSTVPHAPAKTGGVSAGAATISNTKIAGLAGQIKLGAGVAADPTMLRDGVAVDVNPTNLAGFTTRLNALVSSLGTARSFDGAAAATTSSSLVDFGNSSVSWLQDKRSQATSTAAYKQTLLDRTKETLSNETGININEESLRLLDLERSYQASAKILSTVDEMIKALLNSI